MGTSSAAAIGRHAHHIVDALDREWCEIVTGSPDPVRTWGLRHPAVAGCAGLADVLRLAESGDDGILLALLVEAHSGDTLAARTVLQSQLGRMVRMAGRDRRASLDDYVAASWCGIRTYPLQARPARIAANLALDTLKAVQREVRWWRRDGASAWLVGDDLDAVVEQWAHRSALDHQSSSALSAVDVIETGRRLRLLDGTASVLLRHVYLEGLSGAETAARTSSTPGSVRVRCSRAVRRLADHAPALLEAA